MGKKQTLLELGMTPIPKTYPFGLGKRPPEQCCAEIRRHDGVYGFKACQRRAIGYRRGKYSSELPLCRRHAHLAMPAVSPQAR